jgi:hypothetical protein
MNTAENKKMLPPNHLRMKVRGANGLPPIMKSQLVSGCAFYERAWCKNRHPLPAPHIQPDRFLYYLCNLPVFITYAAIIIFTALLHAYGCTVIEFLLFRI